MNTDLGLFQSHSAYLLFLLFVYLHFFTANYVNLLIQWVRTFIFCFFIFFFCLLAFLLCVCLCVAKKQSKQAKKQIKQTKMNVGFGTEAFLLCLVSCICLASYLLFSMSSIKPGVLWCASLCFFTFFLFFFFNTWGTTSTKREYSSTNSQFTKKKKQRTKKKWKNEKKMF